ncbi:hypothetical protein AAY473_021659 [Plecturocebus cupreus]
MPVIPALREAEAGGSPEIFNLYKTLRECATGKRPQKYSHIIPFLYLSEELTKIKGSLAEGWSAVAKSQLTVTSASWVQVIHLSQPPEYLGLQACTTMPV